MRTKKQFQEAAQRRTKHYKGKYIGPDKYKGKIPKHLRHKYKGKYFGKESGKGANPAYAGDFKPSTKGVTKAPGRISKTPVNTGPMKPKKKLHTMPIGKIGVKRRPVFGNTLKAPTKAPFTQSPVKAKRSASPVFPGRKTARASSAFKQFR